VQDVFDIYTIIFLALAVFIFLRLRSVLGQRTGRERPPYDPYAARERTRPTGNDKVVALPSRGPAESAAKPAEDAKPADRWKGIAQPDSAVAKGLDAITAEDKAFEPKHFLGGERETRGETAETRFVSIDSTDIIGAELRGKIAQVTIRFVSQLVSVTRDKNGVVKDGNPDKVTDVTDVWTFARDVTSRDPNWKLVATETGQ
jgi:predicted lipid-binding transport protein (Tim44 family)